VIDAMDRVPWLFYKVSFPVAWGGIVTALAILVVMVLLRGEKVRGSLWWMLAPVAALVGVVALCVVVG